MAPEGRRRGKRSRERKFREGREKEIYSESVIFCKSLRRCLFGLHNPLLTLLSLFAFIFLF